MRSKSFRESEQFLRNKFKQEGRWGFPMVQKDNIDLGNIELIACSDTRSNDTKNRHKGVHFFVDDYRFTGIYDHPDRTLAKYSQYRFLLTPQFSLYAEMPQWKQIESIGKSRWCGAYWQSKGLKVINSLCWCNSQSFDFCFDGIEKHSIVATGTVGCLKAKSAYLRGYDAMLERIEPQAVICFGKPIDGMEGNLIVVDYQASRKVVR